MLMNTKSSSIVSLIIGRGGSSFRGKNIRPVLGAPLLHYAAAAAKNSKYIDRFYLSTDDDEIAKVGAKAGYSIIKRPDFLATDTAQSPDVVEHAYKIIDESGTVDVLIVQHANVGTITSEMIDECIAILIADPELSAVIPCHEIPEYHPWRCKFLNEDGLLEPVFDPKKGSPSANRQDLPTALFPDHSFWVLRCSEALDKPGGQPPWTCWGTKIKPYVTEGCLDVHSVEDLKKTEQWLIERGIAPPKFYE